MVVVFVQSDHSERRNMTARANNVTEFKIRYRNSRVSCAGEGPRYYVDDFSLRRAPSISETYTRKAAIFPHDARSEVKKML